MVTMPQILSKFMNWSDRDIFDDSLMKPLFQYNFHSIEVTGTLQLY